ncbi:MAG: tRNA uridine-5-carboxymethylaminomethyl(34) synthesis GTPase MnmE, partial [Pseudomonadota bacterium]|nr:tRNA uridine-5-carboxymethylaminomethyl(34) synthesis GTPase MnmE [Pseudomonadota bacterium]
MQHLQEDTIAAVATPAGAGGIGIVRVSGPESAGIAKALTGRVPDPRLLMRTRFCDATGAPLDDGIALFFQSPASYTGEDVLELHGHGGPMVMHQLLEQVTTLGARLARPGEFTERAFLNGKLDLVQAEAVADLIGSQTQAAVRA